MTKIVEGRMVVKRINLRLRATAVGETIIRKLDETEPPPPAAEQEENPK